MTRTPEASPHARPRCPVMETATGRKVDVRIEFGKTVIR
jgi:hypothetical protein